MSIDRWRHTLHVVGLTKFNRRAYLDVSKESAQARWMLEFPGHTQHDMDRHTTTIHFDDEFGTPFCYIPEKKDG